MLRDAARLQLALTRAALAEKLITKDATPYNVQFVGTKPVFIDVGSFERLRGGEPWPGYRQFCELFLNPLLIQAVRDVPFQPFLRGSVHGISPDDRRRSAARQRALHEGRVHPRQAARPGRAPVRRRRPRAATSRPSSSGPGSARPDRRPAAQPREGHRGAEVEAAGVDVVRLRRPRPLLARRPAARRRPSSPPPSRPPSPRLVLDLGANDGRFSRLAVAGRRRVRGRRRLRRRRRRPPVPRPPARGRATDPAARARPVRPVAGPRLAVPRAPAVRRTGPARPRAVPRRRPPPGAHQHRAARRDRRASSPTSAPRSSSSSPTATT